VRASLAKFGLHAGKMKFSTHKKKEFKKHVNFVLILPAFFLCIM